MSASNRSSDTAFSGDSDLEYMRKDDSSWHPCHVSLCVTGVGLVVKYENADDGNIVLTGEEALKRLRMRSVLLNGDDCVHIQEGDHILATEKLQTNCLFFDALVEKALKVRHSKRSPCRCTFRIKWLNRDLNEKTLTVTASSIMKLATESINEHPTVCSFIKMLKNLKCYTSPLPNMENDTDQEMDLHELLEKQIEVISNSVDVSESFAKDFQLGIQFNKKGEIQCRTVAKPDVSKPFVLVSSESTTPQRTTRSGRKLQKEIKNPNQPPPAPPDSFIHGLHETPLLNPLAARAAFASLMSKVPHEGKFSVKLNFMQSLYETKSPNCPDISPQTTSVSYEPQLSVTSSELSTLERAKGNKYSNIPDTMPSLSCPAAKRKLSSPSPPKAVKTARASIAKDSIQRETRAAKKTLVSPNSSGWITRSDVRNVNQAQTMDDKQGIEEYLTDKLINSHSSNRNDTVKSDIVVKIVDQGNNNLGEEEGKELEDQLNASVGLKNSAGIDRLTRSKVHEGKKSQTVKATYVLEEHGFAESTWSSSFEGKGSVPKGKVAGSVESKEIMKNGPFSKMNELRRSPRTRSQKN